MLRWSRLLAACAAGFIFLSVALATRAGGEPVLAIVIDDLGNQRDEGIRAVELPGPVTYAFLPHTPHGPGLARLAHALDKEVIVHLPMQAASRRTLGPGGLTDALSREQFMARAHAALDSVPHAQGVNNHMGSHLTALSRPMTWLMDLLSRREDFLFLDSRTTARSVAESTARAAGIRTTYRDVFLDNDLDDDAIAARLSEAIATARRNGAAVAIGHPYRSTLRVLARKLPRLSLRGVRLAPLSAVIARRTARPVQVAQSLSGHAAPMRHTPIAPRTQVSNGAPANMTGWKPSSP